MTLDIFKKFLAAYDAIQKILAFLNENKHLADQFFVLVQTLIDQLKNKTVSGPLEVPVELKGIEAEIQEVYAKLAE